MFSLPFFLRVLVMVLLTGTVCACGQYGDLYLRDKPPAGYKPPKPRPPEPVPYPAQPADTDSAPKN
jgi:predicted small lipoprotein YifL